MLKWIHKFHSVGVLMFTEIISASRWCNGVWSGNGQWIVYGTCLQYNWFLSGTMCYLILSSRHCSFLILHIFTCWFIEPSLVDLLWEALIYCGKRFRPGLILRWGRGAWAREGIGWLRLLAKSTCFLLLKDFWGS